LEGNALFFNLLDSLVVCEINGKKLKKKDPIVDNGESFLPT